MNRIEKENIKFENVVKMNKKEQNIIADLCRTAELDKIAEINTKEKNETEINYYGVYNIEEKTFNVKLNKEKKLELTEEEKEIIFEEFKKYCIEEVKEEYPEVKTFDNSVKEIIKNTDIVELFFQMYIYSKKNKIKEKR